MAWTRRLVVGLVALALTCATGCHETATQRPKDRVRLQLKWVPQAQFAGYFAAQSQGLYDRENLDVTILPGGISPTAEQIVGDGGAEIGIDWLPSLLATRQSGGALVNIAQVFQHSAMREVAFRTSGIRSVPDLRGRRVGVWGGGNQYELLATLGRHGLDPQRDLTVVEVQAGQGIAMLLAHQLDATAAMTYNEYKQILDRGVRPEELVVIDFEQEGTAMLEDGLFVRQDWLKDPRNQDVAARFLRASLRGWEFCRDRPDDCVAITMKQNPELDRDRQTWMMTEVNRLIWDAPAPPLGYMDPAAFEQTAEIAVRLGVTSRGAAQDSYTHQIWELARR